MAYRRTEEISTKLAVRRKQILGATRRFIAEHGFRELNMQRVAETCGVATGTLYRYFPSKVDLCAEVVDTVSEREIAVLREIAVYAHPPLVRLWAVVATFSNRALEAPTLAYAMMAEPVEPEIDRLRLKYRGELAGVIDSLIERSVADDALPPQNAPATAAFIVGAFIEGIIGPHAPGAGLTAGGSRQLVRDITVFCLRGAGGRPTDLKRAEAAAVDAMRAARRRFTEN